jgi:hypothetical protein
MLCGVFKIECLAFSNDARYMPWSLQEFGFISWEVWRERNARIFRNEVSTAAVIAKRIHDEGRQWIDEGFTPLAALWAFFDNAGVAQTSIV